MIDRSDALGLPLFELPHDLPYMDCIIAIYELITQRQLAVLRRVEAMHALLTDTILNQQGLEGICIVLRQVTGNPVFITSPGGAFLAYKTEEEEGDYAECVKGILEELFSSAQAHDLQWNKCNALPPREGRDLVAVPIYVQTEHIAYLVMDATGNALADVELMAFEQAGSMVAVELLNEQARWQREQKVREQLLDDLLMKRYGDEQLLAQRGRYLGFDIMGKYCLFVIDADSFEEALKNDMLGLSENKVQRLKTQVQQIIRTGMAAYDCPSLVLDSGMGAVGMISVRRQYDIAECAAAVGKIIAQLQNVAVGINFSAGLSRAKQGIKHVEQGRREATLAMRAGRGLQFDGLTHRVHSFGELGCLCFLSELSGSAAAREFYEDTMRPLIEHDRQNNSELVKTLECYFMSSQNLRKTAEALFVHKNSVIYRLGRIKTLLSKDLDDPRAAFDLQLCLKLRSVF
jgi:purine catabolism regulator